MPTFLAELSQAQWVIHGFLFLANIALFLLARPLFNLIEPGAKSDGKIKVFRFLNIIVFILHIADLVLGSADSPYSEYIRKIGQSLVFIYGGILVYSLLGAQNRRRFGRKKNVDNKPIYLDTYNTRMVNLVILIVIAAAMIYILLKVWGIDSLLEATGVYALVGVFFALTSNVWAPDIMSGLIILNSETLEDGDVIVIDGHTNEYVISRVTLIYIILYDIRNNHRTLMRNSLFMQNRIDNLSRIASLRGVRQSLKYKIGYPEISGGRIERTAQLAAFEEAVNSLFNAVQSACLENDNIKINQNQPFEWAMTNAGDYALEYTLWVYLEKIPNTKITRTLRKHLMGTLYKINELVFRLSVAYDIDLSTPDQHQIRLLGKASVPANS